MENYALYGVRKLFKIAHLNDKAVSVVFINDLSLNAFVAGGSTVYIHAGLITQAKNSDEFFGVLAHETGHVVGGHIIRLQQQMAKAQTTALITTILGGVAAVASGRGDVGIAIMMGSMGSVEGLLNSYRQTEENSADSIAVDLISQTEWSPVGLLGVMQTMEKQERLRVDNVPTYMRSHPMTRDRLTFLKEATQKHPKPIRNDMEFLLIKAKLFAFLQTPKETFTVYDNLDNLPDLYANAIANFKQTNIQKALEQTDELIKKMPDDPYFYELKGQILFETGQVDKAIEAYTKANQLLPNAPLIRLSLAHALLENGKTKDLAKARSHLEYITATDKAMPDAWYFLNIAYAREGKAALADYAKIEYKLLTGDKDQLTALINKTKTALKNDKVKSLRLDDIEEQLKATQ